MKKREFILLLTITLLLIIPLQISAKTVTGKVITGKTTDSNLAITISIVSSPSLTIIKPENKIYLSNKLILLNYSANTGSTIWYNLDSGNNITINSPKYLNVTQGTHILYMYSNNSGRITMKNVTFTANSTKFIILYEKYTGIHKGSSTNFNASTYEDIQNLRGIILENTNYGKIHFDGSINLTNDLDFSNNLLNLDTNTNISFNKIELNSTVLPNFNKSATLTLYGLNFSNPRILRDGILCSSSICTMNSYSKGNLSFNVTQFSTYSAEETPAGTTPPKTTKTGTTTTGVNSTIPEIIKLDKNKFSITIKQGEMKTENITITNMGNLKRKIDLNISGISSFIKLGDKSFYLNAGEKKIITLNITTRKDTPPKLYQGELIVKSGSAKKEVLIAINVESEGSLFDVIVNIPNAFLQVVAGGDVIANIKLLEINDSRKVNVDLKYLITDGKGHTIASQTETVTVTKQSNFVKSIKIPLNTKEGNYLFYVEANYSNKSASASVWFKVRSKTFLERILPPLIIILIISIIIVIIILLAIRLRYEIEMIKERIKS